MELSMSNHTPSYEKSMPERHFHVFVKNPGAYFNSTISTNQIFETNAALGICKKHLNAAAQRALGHRVINLLTHSTVD